MLWLTPTKSFEFVSPNSIDDCARILEVEFEGRTVWRVIAMYSFEVEVYPLPDHSYRFHVTKKVASGRRAIQLEGYLISWNETMTRVNGVAQLRPTHWFRGIANWVPFVAPFWFGLTIGWGLISIGLPKESGNAVVLLLWLTIPLWIFFLRKWVLTADEARLVRAIEQVLCTPLKEANAARRKVKRQQSE